MFSHLLLDVVKGIRGVDSKADENDMGIRVRQWTETIVIFLTCRIPQGQFDVFAIDLDIGNVILENSWDIDL